MAEQELINKYLPSTLLTSSKIDQLEFIQLLFNGSKRVKIHALLICRSAFDEYQKAPDETDLIQFFGMFWHQTQLQQQKGHFVMGLTVMAFLIDSLIAFDTIKEKLKSIKTHHFLQTAFLSADAVEQKYVVYILRKLSEANGAESTQINIAWKTFFLIYDTSIEKQSHLINPVLDMMHRIEQLPYGWELVLLCHLLKTSNTYVLQRVVSIALAVDISKTALHQLTLIEHLIKALDNTALFQNDVCTTKSLTTFISKCGSLTPLLQSTISKINWKPVPFYHICMALIESRAFVESDSDSFLTTIVDHAAAIPSVWLRNTLLMRLSDVVTSDEGCWISVLDSVDDYLHLQNDNVSLIRSINVHLNQFINATIDGTYKIASQYLQKPVTRSDVMYEVLKTIGETIPGVDVELYEPIQQFDKNTAPRKLLNFVILSKSNAFVLITQMIYNTTFIRMAKSLSESATKLLHTLSGYHLRLAIQFLKVMQILNCHIFIISLFYLKENLKTFSEGELEDMLQICFTELLTGKQSTKLLSRYVCS